jgi:predicted RNA-binding Zn-ribbon protein involved in translation (DUF1610 family)
MKRTTKKEQYVMICPKCGSADISSDFSSQSYGQGSFFNEHKCNSCSYKGELFPEVPIIKLKKNKQTKNSKTHKGKKSSIKRKKIIKQEDNKIENKFIKTYTIIIVIFGLVMLLTVPSFFLNSSIYSTVRLYASLPEPIIILLSIIVLIYILIKKLNNIFIILPIIDIIGAIISMSFITLKLGVASYLIDGIKYLLVVIFGIYLLKTK